MGRPLAVLLAALLSFPAHAERADRAGFTQSQKAAAGLEGWPQWSRVEVWTTGTAGDEDGLFHGKLSLKWMLDIDAGGFYLGDAPVLADINGNGRDDLVVIQYFPKEGWRLLVARTRGCRGWRVGVPTASSGVGAAARCGLGSRSGRRPG